MPRTIELWYDDETYEPNAQGIGLRKVHTLPWAWHTCNNTPGSGVPTCFTRVAAGVYHSIALTADGRALRIGDGGYLPNPPNPARRGPIAQIAAGGRTSVVLYDTSSSSSDAEASDRLRVAISSTEARSHRTTSCAELRLRRSSTTDGSPAASAARRPASTRLEVVACDDARTGIPFLS